MTQDVRGGECTVSLYSTHVHYILLWVGVFTAHEHNHVATTATTDHPTYLARLEYAYVCLFVPVLFHLVHTMLLLFGIH